MTLCYCNDSRFLCSNFIQLNQVFAQLPAGHQTLKQTLELLIEASGRLRTLRKRPILGAGGCPVSRFQAQAIQRGKLYSIIFIIFYFTVRCGKPALDRRIFLASVVIIDACKRNRHSLISDGVLCSFATRSLCVFAAY